MVFSSIAAFLGRFHNATTITDDDGKVEARKWAEFIQAFETAVTQDERDVQEELRRARASGPPTQPRDGHGEDQESHPLPQGTPQDVCTNFRGNRASPVTC